MTLILRNVRPWGGAPADLVVAGGVIAAVGGEVARGSDEIDGRGAVVLPGLHDHHLHLLALAARRESVDLSALLDPVAITARLRASPAPFIRAVAYDERAVGLPDAAMLDSWVADRPLRLQDRTGALWVLNSAALALLPPGLPAGAERDASGRPTGRFWREDRWLGEALGQAAPDLAALGRELAGYGLTALTDAGAGNGPGEAEVLAGALPQRLTLLGSEALPPGEGYARGPLKLLFDERDPPPVEAIAARIAAGRAQRRNVAAHCVTEGELALYLAALDIAGGARRGDRIEHGGMIPAEFIPVIAAAGLTVVTNPAFLNDRGDRYRTEVESLDDLYRIGSLAAAGIALLAGSDAPYASPDPWVGIRAARYRATAAGHVLASAERIGAAAALALYCAGRIEPGVPADLILCEGGLADVLADCDRDRVRMTLIGGEVVHGG